jgi:hypothetical protein
MMGARDCINKKAAAGIVTQDQAKAASDLYDGQRAELNRLNAPDAETGAERRTLAALKSRALAKKKLVAASLKAQDAARIRIEGTRKNATAAALAILDLDPRGKFHGTNIVQSVRNIEHQAFALMHGFVERFRTRFANVDKLPGPVMAQRKALLRDVVRELKGEGSGSKEAGALAEGVSESFEHLRKLANASGFTIPELKGWGLPQLWSRRLLAGITEDGLDKLGPKEVRARKAQIFADAVMPHLDREKMLDFDTRLPLTDPSLRKLLTDTYESIVTDGLSDAKPGVSLGGLAARRMQARVLFFKNADSWLAMHDRFSQENLIDVVLHHVRSMSRDIAMMRSMGASPEATARYIERLIAKERGEGALESVGKSAMRQAGNLFGGAKRFRRNFDLVSGAMSAAEHSGFAVVSEANRSLVYAATLGGAVFSALSDRAFSFAEADLLGIPQGRLLARFLKELNPASIADQKLALQVHLGAEEMIGAHIATARYAGEILNPSVMRTVADSVTRASGLVRMTTAGRQAIQLELLGLLTRNRKVPFEKLPTGIRRGFDLNGITKADWDEFRTLEPFKADNGAVLLRPNDLIGDPGQLEAGPLFDRRFDLAQKFTQMLDTAKEFAVPSVSTRARADLLAGSNPGSPLGEFMRNVVALKSFSLTLMYMHLNRAILGTLPAFTRAKFIAQLVIGATVMGALGEQASQISKGKDPMDMRPTTDKGRKFWLNAALRGGGLGIFGDFIFSDVNRFGGGLGETVLGPVFGTELTKLGKFAVGNVQELLQQGKAKNAGREFEDFARSMTPGHSLWYATLAMDRLIFDEIQKLIDPNYAESFHRIEQSTRHDTGQNYWSPPGSGLPPPRGPQLGPAIGARP